MKRYVFVLFLLLLVYHISSVTAASIIATASEGDRVVQAGGEATFILTLKNTQLREDSFTLRVDDFSVAPFSDVIERVSFEPSSLIKIPANNEKQVTVKIAFLETARVDKNYVTDVTIKSTTNSELSTTVGLSTYVISPRDVIDIMLTMPPSLIPGRKETLIAIFTNNANIDFEKLDIFYTSPVFNAEDTVRLSSLDKKELPLLLTLDSLTTPGDYSLIVRVFEEGKIKGSKSFPFSVGLNPDLREVEESRRQFLRNNVEIVRENEGNTIVSKTVKYPLGYVQYLFTRTSPSGELVIVNGQRMYQWVFDIPPGDIYRIEIVTDYRTPFFTFVGILNFIALFFYFRQKNIQIKKSVFKVHEPKDAQGVTELKILLRVKNRTHKEMYHVKIIDLLPRTIKLDMEFGTLKPVKIEEGTMGMRLLWELDKLDPGDERVLTYKVKTKLSIEGKFTLPAAVAQYYGRKKRIVNVKSNELVYRL